MPSSAGEQRGQSSGVLLPTPKMMKKKSVRSDLRRWPQPVRPCNDQQQQKNPLIVHVNTPEVIHARPQEFMRLVQLLTGKPSLPPSQLISFSVPNIDLNKGVESEETSNFSMDINGF